MASAQDIQAGKAYVLLFLKNDMSSQLSLALKKSGGELKRFGRDATMAGLKMAATGAAIAAPIILGMREFANFDAAMRSVATMLDKPAEFMPGFTQGIKDMAVEFGKTKGDLATGLYDILSATVAPELAMQRLAAATKLAAAGNAEVSASVSVLNTLMDTYGDSVSNAADASDFLYAIVKRGRTTLPELAQNLGQIIAVAEAAGMSLTDMGASVALLTRATGGTDTALTALQAISATFLKPGAAGAALWAEKFGDQLDSSTLKVIGMVGVLERLSTLDAGDVGVIFPNIRALRGMFPAIKKMEGFSEDLRQMGKRAGNVDAAFEKMKGPQLAWQQGLEIGKNIMLEIGQAVVDFIMPYKESIKAIAKATGEWIKENKGLVVTFAGVAAVLVVAGTALTVLGIAATFAGVGVTALGTAIAFLSAHPLVMLAAGLAAVVMGITALVVANKALATSTKKLSDEMAKALAKGDELRAAEQARLDQLITMGEKQSLSSDEMVTATSIIQELTAKYGDMGLSINKATGAIEGMTTAQQKLNEAQAAAERRELKASIAEEQRNLSQLMKDNLEATKRTSLFELPNFLGRPPSAGPYEGWSQSEELDKRAEGMNAQLRKINDLLERYKELKTAADAAITGDAATGDGAPYQQPDLGPSDDVLAMNRRILDQISDYRIGLIKDEEAQAIASINKRYDAESDKAKELGAELGIVERAREMAHGEVKEDFKKRRKDENSQRILANQSLIDQSERLNIERSVTDERERQRQLIEHDRKTALRSALWDTSPGGADDFAINEYYDARQKASDLEMDQREKRQRDSRTVANQSLLDQSERLKIESGITDEHERQQLLIEHDRKIALESALRAGPGGASDFAINEYYDTKLQAADMDKRNAQQRDVIQPRATLTATYSAAAARIGGYQAGGGPNQRMADGIGSIAKDTAALVGSAVAFIAGQRMR